MSFGLSDHVETEIIRRRLTVHILEELLSAPEQIVPGHNARIIINPDLNLRMGEYISYEP